MRVFKAEIGQLFTPQVHNLRFTFLKNCDFSPFWSKMAQNLISQGTWKTDFGEHIIDQFLLQMCQNARKKWDYDIL